jgi:hypothetical protein
MTAKQFTTWAEAVYGKYTPAMRLEVEKWLEDNARSPVWTDALRQVVLENYDSGYGRLPPDVHQVFALRLQVHPLSHKLEDERRLLEKKEDEG